MTRVGGDIERCGLGKRGRMAIVLRFEGEFNTEYTEGVFDERKR